MSKNKPQKVGTYFQTKSMAQLDEEIKKILAEEHPDKDIREFINDGREFAGYSPPHTINGVPYEELIKQRQKLEDDEDS